MKKNIFKYLLIFGMGLLAFNACTEDDLYIPPYGKIIGDVDPNKPIKVTDAAASIISAYEPVGWSYPWGMSSYITLTVSSDEALSGGSNASDRPEYEGACKHSLNYMNDGPKQLWERFYVGVARCNKFLEDYPVSKAPNSDSLKRFNAEAKFLRAFYYFNIVNIFGPAAPLVLDSKTNLASSSSLAATYDQIEKDLKESIDGLPATRVGWTKAELEWSRATKGVAHAFLGKVYLFRSTMLKEDKWQDAYNEFTTVVNSNEFKLETSFRSLWMSTNEIKNGNKEFIFTTNYQAIGHNWGGKNVGNIDIQLCGVRSLVPAKTYGPILDGWGFLRPTQKLVDGFNAENDSIRLDESVWDLKKVVALGGSYADPYDATGYTAKKYSAKEAAVSNSYPMDYVILRYSDVLLMLAEVANHLGKDTEALGYVNQVRARVKLNPISSTGTALFNDIVKERKLELALEGIRYWDLIRWGLAAQEIPFWNPATKGLWPVNYSDLKSNPGIAQNEGY